MTIVGKIVNISKVKSYLVEACALIKSLYTSIYGAQAMQVMQRQACSVDARWQGAVSADSLEDAMINGNMREQVYILTSLSLSVATIMEILKQRAKLTQLINAKNVERLLNRLMHETGFTVESDFFSFYNTHKNDNYWGQMLSQPYEGPVSLARYEGMNPPARIRRTGTTPVASIKVCNAVPPLSSREVTFICQKTRKNNLAPNDDLPWETGEMSWQMSPNGLFRDIAQMGHNLMLTGPSGSTDIFLKGMSILANYNLELSVLAYTALSCGGHNHSLFEILLAAEAHGLSFNSKMHAVTYFQNLIDKYSPSQQQQQFALFTAVRNFKCVNDNTIVIYLPNYQVKLDGITYNMMRPPAGHPNPKMQIIRHPNSPTADLVYAIKQ